MSKKQVAQFEPKVDLNHVIAELQALITAHGSISLDKNSSYKLISWLNSVNAHINEQTKLIELLKEFDKP